MPQFHQQTKHSYISVRKNSFFLDWNSQARNFKKYPHFYPRYKIAKYESLKDLELIGNISAKKEYPQGCYYLRTNPSAGGLYPCEIYIQIRGVEGLVDGIYHFEPYEESLVLLLDVEKNGVEHYFKNHIKEKGFVFLLSTVYFRSSWKYRDRALRYIFLDSGHQLGSIYATMKLMEKESRLCFDFDKLALNELFGFREDELFTVALKASQTLKKEVQELKQPLAYVCGSDYLETNEFIYNSYKESAKSQTKEFVMEDLFADISKEKLKTVIQQRRSIRAFKKLGITKEEFNTITHSLFSFAKKHNISIYYTIHQVEGMAMGLYLYDSLIKEGDFRSKSRYLSLEQNLGGESACTFYFASSQIQEYQKVNILSGFIAQIIYLKGESLGVGCSGIGAYYDDEVKQFLETKENILYLLAIGR